MTTTQLATICAVLAVDGLIALWVWRRSDKP